MSKSNVTRYNSQWPEPFPPEMYQHGYPGEHATSSVASTASRPSQFLGTYGDMSLLEDGMYRKKYGDLGDNYHKIHAKAGEKMDPRLLMLLEFFRELYLRRREMFKKIFPGKQDEFVDTFNKIRAILLSGKSGQVSDTRALRRTRSLGGGHEPLRLERFKVKTINPGGGSGGGVGAGSGGAQGGGQGDVKTGGVSESK